MTDEPTTDDLVENAADELVLALRASDWFAGVSRPVLAYGTARKLIVISDGGDVFEVEIDRALKPAERRS
jgi:hypothetical protein